MKLILDRYTMNSPPIYIQGVPRAAPPELNLDAPLRKIGSIDGPLPSDEIEQRRVAAQTQFEAEISDIEGKNRWTNLTPAERVLLRKYPPYKFYTDSGKKKQAWRVYGVSSAADGSPCLHVATLSYASLVKIKVNPERALPIEQWSKAHSSAIEFSAETAAFFDPAGWVLIE